MIQLYTATTAAAAAAAVVCCCCCALTNKHQPAPPNPRQQKCVKYFILHPIWSTHPTFTHPGLPCPGHTRPCRTHPLLIADYWELDESVMHANSEGKQVTSRLWTKTDPDPKWKSVRCVVGIIACESLLAIKGGAKKLECTMPMELKDSVVWRGVD